MKKISKTIMGFSRFLLRYITLAFGYKEIAKNIQKCYKESSDI